MYKLDAPIIEESDKEYKILCKLLKEILGYTQDEINEFTKNNFNCDIAINLTIEQAKKITEPFYDNDVQIYLSDQKDDTPLFWQRDLGICLVKREPKEHYCNEPLVSREHLVNPYTQYEIERQRINQRKQESLKQTPIISCPICQSTNLSKISIAKKAVKIGFFGIFGAIDDAGKIWRCNSCGSKF